MASGKKAGRHSQASNDFLEPLKPTGVSATNIGTSRAYGDGAADVSFSLPALSPNATSFTVTSSTGQTGTGSSSPIRVQGITANASVTFTVTASNAAGTSQASDPSSAIAITSVPQTPQSVSATTVSANLNRVSWTTPATGGSAITSYTITSSDGGSFTGISAGATSYDPADSTPDAPNPGAQTYTIVAINALGTSAATTASSVTTIAPFFPFFPPFFPFFPPFFPFFPPFFPYFPFFPPYFPFFPPYFPYFPFFPPFFPFFPPFFPPYFPYFPAPYFSDPRK